VELVRVGKLEEAIEYARVHLVSWSGTHLKEIQQAMALLAFSPNTDCGIYKALFDSSRWTRLISEFQKNNHELHNLSSQSLLNMTLQVGLSALKTAACYQPENQNIHCPVCAKDTFGKLAEGLPQAHHLNSCIVCRISGELMNEDNPPMVLPNGNVYSARALKEMASRNDGNVECPRTGAIYSLSKCKKAFVL
jgi:macrophage erythroblast attacher